MGRSFEARAKEAVEQGTWHELAWANTKNIKFVTLIYETAAAEDPTLALAYDSFRNVRNDKPHSWKPFLGIPQTQLAPFIVSALHQDWWHNHLPIMFRHGLDIGEAMVPRLKDSPERDKILPVLSGSPYEEDRDAAFATLADAPQKPDSYKSHYSKKVDAFQLATGFARQNDPRGDALLTQTLDAMVDPEYIPRERDGRDELLFALERRIESPLASEWAQKLVGLLPRGLAIYSTLRVFAEAGHREAIQASTEAFASMLIDDTPHTRVRRVGCQLVLAHEQHAPDLEDARWVRKYLGPQRYGWPSEGRLADVHKLCGELLFHFGNEEEKEWVASFARSSYHVLHEIGDHARQALGLPPVVRRIIGEKHIDHLSQDDDLEGILALMQDEDTIWDSSAHYRAIRYITPQTREDSALQERFIKWARAKIEGQPNRPIVHYETTPPDTRYLLSFLKELPEETRQAHLAESESLWIRHICFEEKNVYPTPPEPSPHGAVSVASMTDTRFAPTTNVIAMAISDAGDRLCLVGNGGGCIMSLPDGELVATLKTGGYAYDCLFTPDQEHVVACFHGGHVWVFDAQSGEMVRKFEGHSGVPNGMRCLAFNEDGTRMASGDSDGTLIGWDVASGKKLWEQTAKGTFASIAFLPDGRVIASHSRETRKGTKANGILLVSEDGQTGKSSKQADPVNAMAIGPNKLLALGGEGPLRIGDWTKTRFKVHHELDLPEVVALDWQGEQLLACTQSGTLAFIDCSQDEPTVERVELDITCGDMVRDGETIYLQSGSIRIVDGQELRPTAAKHPDRVVDALELSDGTLFTLDRKCNILRWAQGSQMPTTFASLGGFTKSLVPIDDESFACATPKGLQVIDTQSGEVTHTSAEELACEVACAFDDHCAYADKEGISFVELPSFAPEGKEKIAARRVSALANSPDGMRLLMGTENGWIGLWGAGEWQWLFKGHGSDILEEGNPHCAICSLAFSPDGKYAISGATDDVVRVYNAEDGKLLLRIRTRFGLYDRLSVSPDSRWLAIPDGKLTIVDLKKQRIHAILTPASFAEQGPQTAHFMKDGTLAVSSTRNDLFRVTIH